MTLNLVLGALVASCVLLAGPVTGKSLPLPPYLKACSRNEPDLQACILKRGREALLSVLHEGDKRYKIPRLEPLTITKLHVHEGVLGLNLTVTDILMRGLKQGRLDDISWNMTKKTGSYHLSFPRIEALGQYDINGRILILPIYGKGAANFTILNVKVDYLFDWEIIKKADGESYVLPSNSTLRFDTTRLYCHLDNLFNGNKLLGTEMNRFIDENWRELKTELGPVLGQAMGDVMRQIQFNVFDLVSYENAFPNKPPA